MMFMTARVNPKKVALILGAVVVAVIAAILLLGGGKAEATSAAVSSNDARVKFLSDLGWEVTTSPAESGQVRIPEKTTEVFDRYNELQKSQGYDLSQYAGKNVMRYVYIVNNYSGATDPVYATLLIYKNEVIGGDITDTAVHGKVQGLKKTQDNAESTAPTTATSSSIAAEE